jgi:hypothetical protein
MRNYKNVQKNSEPRTLKEKISSYERSIRALHNERLELSDVKEVMSTEAGKRFVQWIIKNSDLFADPFTGRSDTYHILGIQKTGREILNKLIAAECDIDLKDYMNRSTSKTISDIDNQIIQLSDDIKKIKDGGKTR